MVGLLIFSRAFCALRLRADPFPALARPWPRVAVRTNGVRRETCVDRHVRPTTLCFGRHLAFVNFPPPHIVSSLSKKSRHPHAHIAPPPTYLSPSNSVFAFLPQLFSSVNSRTIFSSRHEVKPLSSINSLVLSLVVFVFIVGVLDVLRRSLASLVAAKQDVFPKATARASSETRRCPQPVSPAEHEPHSRQSRLDGPTPSPKSSSLRRVVFFSRVILAFTSPQVDAMPPHDTKGRGRHQPTSGARPFSRYRRVYSYSKPRRAQ